MKKKQKSNKVFFISICSISFFSLFICLFIFVLLIKNQMKLSEQQNDVTNKIDKINNLNSSIEIDEKVLNDAIKKNISQEFHQKLINLKNQIDSIQNTNNIPKYENKEKKLDSTNLENKPTDSDSIENFKNSFPQGTLFFPEPKERWNKLPDFNKVIGMDKEKKSLNDFLDYIKHPDRYTNKRVGKVDFPQGVLFYGVPGTGKTFLTRALAKESGETVSFYELNSSEFARGIVGEGPERVRKLFEDVRERNKNDGVSASIIFIDECEETFKDLDNLGENTSKDIANIVNQFKQELTSTKNDPKKPIFVIGATNYYNKIDSAIKSRLDIHIEIEPLSIEARQKYLELIINQIRQNPYTPESMNYLFSIVNPIIEKMKKEDQVQRKLEKMLSSAILKTIRIGENIIKKEELKQAFLQIYENNILTMDEHIKMLDKFLFDESISSHTLFVQDNVRSQIKTEDFKNTIKNIIIKEVNKGEFKYITDENNSTVLLKQLMLILKNMRKSKERPLNLEDIKEAYFSFYDELCNIQNKIQIYQIPMDIQTKFGIVNQTNNPKNDK